MGILTLMLKELMKNNSDNNIYKQYICLLLQHIALSWHICLTLYNNNIIIIKIILI